MPTGSTKTSLIEILDEKRITIRETRNILTGETRVEMIPEEIDLDAQASVAGVVQEALFYLFHTGEVSNIISQHFGIVLDERRETTDNA